jgi:hypothetical protein
MAAVILDLADAVVDQLNAATLSQAFTAERLYAPLEDLETLSALKVTVVPRSLASRPLSRAWDSFDYQLDIGVQQKTDLSEAMLDGLMLLVEEIVDLLRPGPLTSYPAGRVVDVANQPIWAADHLNEKHVFTSVITLTIKVWR